VNEEGLFIGRHEYGAGGSTNKSLEPTDKNNAEVNLNTKGGYAMDFHFVNADGKDKTHFIIELKTESSNQKDMLKSALRGLKQIFTNDYPRHILSSTDTKEIFSIGMAANTTHICLATLKALIVNKKYVSFDEIEYQHFKIVEDGGNVPEIDHFGQNKHRIDFSVIAAESDPKATEGGNTDKGNQQMIETVIGEIDKLIKDGSEDTK
jgi:hypothetical protein